MFESFKIRRLENQIRLHELTHVKRSLDVLESNTVTDDDYTLGYRILNGNKQYYTESENQEMIGAASKLYYTNPIASGIVETIKNFVIGQTLTITPIDESESVKNYWKKFQDTNKLDNRIKEIVTRTFRDGEQFLRFFDKANDVPLVRFINPLEIQNYTGRPECSYGIKCLDDDIETPEFYYRRYKDSYNIYHDETIKADEIIHSKIKVDMDVKRGVSFFTGIAPYLTKYKKWLDDRIELNRLRTIFNVVGKVTGSSSTSAVKGMVPNTSPPNNSGINNDTLKQSPKSGGVLLTKGVEWDLKNLNLGAGDAKADGRAILLMATVGTNLAEYVVTGDTSNANYASTMVSESPMVKAFESWQDYFESVIKSIYAKAIQRGIDSGLIPESSTRTVRSIDKTTGDEIVKQEPCDTSLDCEVNFPILIHRDILQETQSLVAQAASGWVSNQTCSEKLGYEYDREQDRLLREETNRSKSDKQNYDVQLKNDFIKQQMETNGITSAEAAMLWEKGER